MRRWFVATVLLWGLQACANDASCGRDADELARYLGTLPQAMDRMYTPATLVEADGRPIIAAAGLVVRRERLETGGPPIALEELDDILQRWEGNYRLLNPDQPSLILVAIDGDVPWSRVTRVMASIVKAGYHRVELLTAKRLPQKIALPPPSSADAELRKVDKDDTLRAQIYAQVLDATIQKCPSLQGAFRELSEVGLAAKQGMLIAKLPKALRGCGCAVDLAALRSVLFAILRPPVDLEREIRATRLAIEPESSSLALPAKMTWSAAAPTVLAALRANPALQLRVK